TLSGAYNSAFHAPTGGIAYSYSRLLPTFTLRFSRNYARRSGFQRYVYDIPPTTPDGADVPYQQSGYDERITTVRAEIDVPVVRHPVHRASATVSYNYTHFANVGSDPPVDPNAPPSSFPELGAWGQVGLALAYDSRRGVRHAHGDYGAETGRYARVSVNIIDPHLGGRFSDVWVGGTYIEMLRMPWRGHQVLALALSGGASAGTLGRRAPYYLGGTGQQADIIRNFLLRNDYTDVGALRGFQPNAFPGRYYGVLNAEYRIPLADVERGLGTLPGFLRRVALAPFLDLGAAWGMNGERLTRQALKWGLGTSFISSFKIGYGAPIDLVLQYARGLGDEYALHYFRAAVARSF
ncbi:MAG TPA: hypothetical protein VIK91_07095, partial [Nannocystis sp.]